MIRTNLPSHKHPLYPTPWIHSCNGCYRRGGDNKDGYCCYECNISLHKECAESSLEINHPSHLEHPLHFHLITSRYGWQKCKLCNQEVYNMYYYCSICYFVVDTACARNPPPDVIEYPKVHEHSLVVHKNGGRCDLCEEYFGSIYLYKCSQCQLKFHFECSKLPLEINYPFHSKHPIKFITRNEHHFSDGKCRICGEILGNRFYHCLICKFSVDIACVKNPPPLAVLFAKAHEHQLSLLPRIISFSCDACGMDGDRSPYSCQQCDFMIHQSCIDLPEIINVNRHEHRLYRRIHLSPGSWVCGVCYQKVDWSYGAYSCSICPNYAIHSRCAIQGDVWDRLELKGIPKEPQEIEPFKVIHGNLICHFSHEEHYLKLNEDNIVCGGSIRCAACVSPIYSQVFYGCVQCDFVLHETCANLPRKKRHVYHNKLLTLICGDMTIFYCLACGPGNYSSGFRYTDFEGFNIDVKCGALSESVIHESHPCPLYYNNNKNKKCVACSRWSYRSFCCDDCDFAIHHKCVVLPKTTEHWYDEHLFYLCYDKNKSGGYWCDICEKQIETMKWFYTCDICCVIFHTKCVLGDFSLFMPGRIITYIEDIRFEVMQTNPGFLPRCYVCHSQQASPFVLKVFNIKKQIFICSLECFGEIVSYILKEKYK